MTTEHLGRRDAQVLNPLWIISLFLGVSEVTVGIAATQSAGWIQGLLALFAVLFPVGVATAFFVILWLRPFVLYAPGDFSEHTTVTAYVEAMRAPYQPVAAVEEVARHAVEAMRPWMGDGHATAVTHAMNVVREDLARRTITVDVGAALGLTSSGNLLVNIPVDEKTSVAALLNSLATSTGNAVTPNRYGERWVLQLDGTRFADIGSRWAMGCGLPDDDRLLEAVGIPLGSTLTVDIIQERRHNVFRTGYLPGGRDPILTADALPKLGSSEELAKYLIDQRLTLVEIREIGKSLGIIRPKATKAEMIEQISKMVHQRDLYADLLSRK